MTTSHDEEKVIPDDHTEVYDPEKHTIVGSQENRDAEEEGYPGLVECAPFPTLGSLQEITTTLSKTRTRQSVAAASQQTVDGKKAAIEDDSKGEPVPGEFYWTEGIRNPGWLVVLSTFLVNFTVFGTVFTWGNFHKLYLNEVYAGQTTQFKIAFVGTSQNALMLSTGLFVSPIIRKIGYRFTMLIGTILAPLGLVLASYATQLWHVYLAQGILFGIGASFVFTPSVALPAQWFNKNRAFATGLAVSGSGIGGVCLSPMSQSLIQSAGYRNSLRALGGLGFGLLCIATALARPRFRPPSAGGKWWKLIDTKLLNFSFCIFLVFAFLVPFGYVAPFFLAPTYAGVIGVDASMGSSLVSIMSACNAVCRISLGFVGDRYGRLTVMALFTFFSGIFTMVVWQFSSTFGAFVAYCVLFGLTGGGFVSLIPPVTAEIVGVENIQAGIGMAYLLTTCGNLLGTPLIGLLQSAYGWTAAIQFSGSLTVAAGLTAIILRFIRSRGKVFVVI